MENVRENVAYFEYITLILSTIYISNFKKNLLALQSPEHSGVLKPFQQGTHSGDHKILRKYTNTKITIDPPESYCVSI